MSAARTEKANQLIEKNGGKVISMYTLLEVNDIVILTTFPGAVQALKSSMAISKLTGIRSFR